MTSFSLTGIKSLSQEHNLYINTDKNSNLKIGHNIIVFIVFFDQIIQLWGREPWKIQFFFLQILPTPNFWMLV